MIPRHHFLLLLLLLSAHLTGCRAGKPDERHNAALVAPPAVLASATKNYQLPNELVVFSKPSLFNRATDALGISTKEGRAARQQRKDTRAAVPHSIGKGAVYAPNNTGKILSAGNKGGAVANADSGAVVSQVDIGKNKGPVAAGPGASASQAVEKPGFWAVMGAAALRLWWLWLLVAAFLFRKQLPVVGRLFA